LPLESGKEEYGQVKEKGITKLEDGKHVTRGGKSLSYSGKPEDCSF